MTTTQQTTTMVSQQCHIWLTGMAVERVGQKASPAMAGVHETFVKGGSLVQNSVNMYSSTTCNASTSGLLLRSHLCSYNSFPASSQIERTRGVGVRSSQLLGNIITLQPSSFNHKHLPTVLEFLGQSQKPTLCPAVPDAFKIFPEIINVTY